MLLIRSILSKLEIESEDYNPKLKPKSKGDYPLTEDQIKTLNEDGYNIYFFPNYPRKHNGAFIDAGSVDTFEKVFIDMDLKDKVYKSKEQFYEVISAFNLVPNQITDSGNGVHVYWNVSDLDALTFLKLNRRLARHFKTDLAVSKLNQLMRYPNTWNTKKWNRDEWIRCESIYEDSTVSYTSEQLDKELPVLTIEDLEYCTTHYNQAMGVDTLPSFNDDLPRRWFKFATKGSEAHKLFYGTVNDRSKADFRLAHLMLQDGFTKEEAMSVLANTSKSSTRSSNHRYNYASNIVDKMWEEIKQAQLEDQLGATVADLLAESDDDHDEFTGTKLPCSDLFDATVCGFRLSHVMGLIGASGGGKTAVGLNYAYYFVKNNPEYVHIIISLEQPRKEIAKRWKKIAQGNKAMYGNVIIVDNFNDDGTYRNLSLDDCDTYVASLQEQGKKVGLVMVDHIGILKQESKHGEREGIINICTKLKAFAKSRNVFLVMQSQTSREKAKGGDIELNQDAAYGTTQFEWYVNWVVTIWQPLKRLYKVNPDLTVTCVKYCKIRHKHPDDKIKEGTIYAFKFNARTERLRRLNQEERDTYDFFAKQASIERNRDTVKDATPVNDTHWAKESKEDEGKNNVG